MLCQDSEDEFDHDLCLNLWHGLKKLLWQDELNPRVRCAFGNVYFEASIAKRLIAINYIFQEIAETSRYLQDIYVLRILMILDGTGRQVTWQGIMMLAEFFVDIAYSWKSNLTSKSPEVVPNESWNIPQMIPK